MVNKLRVLNIFNWHRSPASNRIIDEEKKLQKYNRNASFFAVLALWNTMLGTSSLVIPWALVKTGVAFSTVVFVVFMLVCLYTAYLIVETQAGIDLPYTVKPDFNVICKHYLGKVGAQAAFFLSTLVIVSATIVIFIYICNYFYYVGDFLYQMNKNKIQLPSIFTNQVICAIDMNTNDSESSNKDDDGSDDLYHNIWNAHLTVPILTAFLIFPLLMIKSPTFLIKFNSIGIFSICYMLALVTLKGAIWGVNWSYTDPKNVSYLPNFKWSFPVLGGVLMMAHFVHNAVLPVLESQPNNSNNTKILVLAFILAMLTYAYIGFTFTLTFPLSKECIADNLLNNMASADILSLIARSFLLVQMVTFYPLLIYIMRFEVTHKFFAEKDFKLKYRFVLNGIMMTISLLFAIFYPNVGNIIRYLGSFSGLGYILILPLMVRFVHLRRHNQLTIYKIIIFLTLVLIGFLTLVVQFFL